MSGITLEQLVGRRIRLVEMFDDPFPVAPGSEGLVVGFGYDCLTVKWDNGRRLGLIDGVDVFEVLD